MTQLTERKTDLNVEAMRKVLARLVRAYKDVSGICDAAYDLSEDAAMLEAERLLQSPPVLENRERFDLALRIAKLCRNPKNLIQASPKLTDAVLQYERLVT